MDVLAGYGIKEIFWSPGKVFNTSFSPFLPATFSSTHNLFFHRQPFLAIKPNSEAPAIPHLTSPSAAPVKQGSPKGNSKCWHLGKYSPLILPPGSCTLHRTYHHSKMSSVHASSFPRPELSNQVRLAQSFCGQASTRQRRGILRALAIYRVGRCNTSVTINTGPGQTPRKQEEQSNQALRSM